MIKLCQILSKLAMEFAKPEVISVGIRYVPTLGRHCTNKLLFSPKRLARLLFKPHALAAVRNQQKKEDKQTLRRGSCKDLQTFHDASVLATLRCMQYDCFGEPLATVFHAIHIYNASTRGHSAIAPMIGLKGLSPNLSIV